MTKESAGEVQTGSCHS